MPPGDRAGPDGVEVRVDRQAPPGAARPPRDHCEQLGTIDLLARMVRIGAQSRQVVLDQLGVEPERDRPRMQPFERRALIPGLRRDANERGKVLGDHARILAHGPPRVT